MRTSWDHPTCRPRHPSPATCRFTRKREGPNPNILVSPRGHRDAKRAARCRPMCLEPSGGDVRCQSGRGEIAQHGAGRNVVVRCAPYRRAAPQDDDLRGFVPYAGSSRDLLRQGPLRPDVHEVRLRVGMCRQERFDLIQGRNANRSGRTMFIQDRPRGPKQGFHVLLGQNPPHRASVRPLLGPIAA